MRRGSAPIRSGGGRSRGAKPALILFGVFTALYLAFFAIVSLREAHRPHRGYYRCDDRPYYYYRGDWYGYDDYGDWYEIDGVDPYLERNYNDYYV